MTNKKFNNWCPKPIINNTTININCTKFNIEAINLDHEVECLGYGLSEIRNKLKEEYKMLTQDELTEKKLNNIEITEEKLFPILFFCGDMGFTTLERLPFDKYKLFIIECSFLEDDHIKEAIDKQHLHINHLIPYVEKYNDTHFIFIHFSCRYTKKIIKQYEQKFSHIKNITFWI